MTPHTLVSAPHYPARKNSTDLSDDGALPSLAEFNSEMKNRCSGASRKRKDMLLR
jgi:hypothetical protein